MEMLNRREGQISLANFNTVPFPLPADPEKISIS
jgi:hypothetical protein